MKEKICSNFPLKNNIIDKLFDCNFLSITNERWWWIVFVVWLTEERRLALLPSSAMDPDRDPDHWNLQHAPSSIWTCAEPEFRLHWIKLYSYDNHYITRKKWPLQYSYIFATFVCLYLYFTFPRFATEIPQ